MGVGVFFLGLFVVVLAGFAVILIGPVLSDLLGSGRLRKELSASKQEARIATKALREIRTNDGNGAYLIADIALQEIESNELKELS